MKCVYKFLHKRGKKITSKNKIFRNTENCVRHDCVMFPYTDANFEQELNVME
jgi:hypothetical protein